MIQTFGDRVQLVVDIQSSSSTITLDGEVVREFSNVKLNELPVQQACAQEIVNNLR